MTDANRQELAGLIDALIMKTLRKDVLMAYVDAVRG